MARRTRPETSEDEPGDGEEMLLVCPECHYGFRSKRQGSYRCPSAACGATFAPSSLTEANALTADGREAVHELALALGPAGSRIHTLGDGPLRIGRDADNEIVIENLQISRHHAVVERDSQRYRLRDLGSATGLLVNGRRASSRTLVVGDRIVIAGMVIEYRVRFTGSRAAEAAVRDGPPLDVPSPWSLWQGGRETDRIAVAGDRISLGRGSDRDVILHDPMVSARHALLTREPGGSSSSTP